MSAGAPHSTRMNRDIAAGLFLIAVAAIGYFGALNLNFGKLSGIGPGLMPQVTAIIVGAFGLLILGLGLTVSPERMDSWSLRGAVFVLGAVVLFAATIRTLGLAASGPMAIILSSIADRDTRPIEIIIFAAILTALCIGLFKYLLRLPIPVLPMVLGY